MGKLLNKYNLIAAGLVAAILLIAAAFGFWPPKPEVKFEAEKEPEPAVAPGELPDLFLVDKNSVKRLSFNKDNKKYVAKNSLDFEHGWRIRATKDRVWVGGFNGLLGSTPNLEKVKENKIGRVEALETAGGYVFAAANGKFYTLDKDLNELGELTLLEQESKDAHNILIQKNKAYLLDNIVMPIYLFEIDLSNLRQPKILRKIDASGVNIHLESQWVDEVSGDWFIFKTSTTQEGNNHAVSVLNKSDTEPSEFYRLYQSTYDYDNRKQEWVIKESGTQVLTATKDLPVWAVTQKENNYFAQELTLVNGKAEFGKAIDLRADMSFVPHKKIKRVGNYLFVTLADALRVVDLQKRAVILSQELDSAVLDFDL